MAHQFKVLLFSDDDKSYLSVPFPGFRDAMQFALNQWADNKYNVNLTLIRDNDPESPYTLFSSVAKDNKYFLDYSWSAGIAETVIDILTEKLRDEG